MMAGKEPLLRCERFEADVLKEGGERAPERDETVDASKGDLPYDGKKVEGEGGD